jgi:hypothetical protein
VHHPSGKFAYDAYLRSVRNCQGEQPPPWDDLSRAVRVAWECVAIMVAGESFRLQEEADVRENHII